MTALTVKDDLAAELKEISARENRSVDDVLRSLLEIYHAKPKDETDQKASALEAFIGAFDDDITDLSSTVRETMDAFYREKYGNTD